MWEMIRESLIDWAISTAIIFAVYLLIEFVSRRWSKNVFTKLRGKFGPLFGALFGSIPQCSFSVVSTTLYSKRAITLGTLFTVYLVTSDEAFIILLAHPDKFIDLLIIFLSKIVIGIFVGYMIDLVLKLLKKDTTLKEYNSRETTSCENENIFLEVGKSTLKISFYLLISLLVIDVCLFYIGKDNISSFLNTHSYIQYLVSPLIGLIPSCAPSVILTELYISGQITYSGIIGGLLTNAGLSLVVLFRYNKPLKENIAITISLYGLGVIFGLIIYGFELIL
ncbi:MAG: putative manganese transporter [Bacilli bacterium]